MRSDTKTRYLFCDTDYSGWDEYDIADDDYSELIDTCCKYSFAVSFRDMGKAPDCLKTIRQHSIKDTGVFRRYAKQFEVTSYSDRKYYRICPEVCEVLKKTGNVFSWFHDADNPYGFEDLSFFREDGSVFFSSRTHDGECNLFPIEGEEIDHIISKGIWIKDPPPSTFNHTPMTQAEYDEHMRQLREIKIEKYQSDLRSLNENISSEEKRNTEWLKNCDGILKIAKKFGFKTDKVVEDLLKLQNTED